MGSVLGQYRLSCAKKLAGVAPSGGLSSSPRGGVLGWGKKVRWGNNSWERKLDYEIFSYDTLLLILNWMFVQC